jgi:hypothetical protein
MADGSFGSPEKNLTEDLEGLNPTDLWGRIRLIRFPTPGRDSKFLIRFDLMKRAAAGS